MTTPLPTPVARLVDAVNRGDTDAFLALFPGDGRVDDWGRRFDGHDAIRAWSEREFTGANGTLTPRKVTTAGQTVTVDAAWKSNFYSGDSRFVFVVEGDGIHEMRIVAH
ncbi:nuclear transport factor 2 family protein [Luteimonas aestuarii]|uniref:Nuclear transport factor 2 family protein n=1 Tax=Luteimonas aestuarii TaxID=453837 RepID=A0A4R5U4G2_9GAMM|nr:nuclear transport factor 2 family protein [Luteimonas aestuarii]TDK28631.1 nuclear transport factor 2 family protein [Luteimonas aestuarii]